LYFPISNHVIPAQAGNQNTATNWFPACAGMTKIAALFQLVFSDQSVSLSSADIA